MHLLALFSLDRSHVLQVQLSFCFERNAAIPPALAGAAAGSEMFTFSIASSACLASGSSDKSTCDECVLIFGQFKNNNLCNLQDL